MLDPLLGPHGQEQKFSGARVYRVTFKNIPHSLRTHIQSFGQLLKFFGLESLYFCDFRNPTTTPSGVLGTVWRKKERKKERRKIPKL
jgi:hypothetical protein